jgi:hypothetical protein
VRLEGLSKAQYFNGLFARIQLRMEGGWYQVVLERDFKVLCLKGDNLLPVDCS